MIRTRLWHHRKFIPSGSHRVQASIFNSCVVWMWGGKCECGSEAAGYWWKRARNAYSVKTRVWRTRVNSLSNVGSTFNLSSVRGMTGVYVGTGCVQLYVWNRLSSLMWPLTSVCVCVCVGARWEQGLIIETRLQDFHCSEPPWSINPFSTWGLTHQYSVLEMHTRAHTLTFHLYPQWFTLTATQKHLNKISQDTNSISC